MFKRDLYLKKLEMYTGRDVCKIVTGVRRCGKTTIIRQFIEELKDGGVPEENIIYLDFEKLIYNYFTSEDGLRDMLAEFMNGAAGHCYIFLDEAGDIRSWGRVCSEMMNLVDCDIYVMSGSKESANVKNYDEVKKFKMNISPLFFYFKGSDEGAARDRIGSLFTLG